MSKLPETIENDLIDLLSPSISDGTLKNRRNLLVSSFTVVAVYMVGKSITDLKVFGVSLEGGNSSKLLLVAIAIILFWLCMFILHAWRDKKIVQAKRRAFDNKIKAVKENIAKTSQTHKGDSTDTVFKNLYISAKTEYEKYKTYQKRLKTARWLTVVTFVIEYSLPVFVAILAIYFLSTDYFSLVDCIKT